MRLLRTLAITLAFALLVALPASAVEVITAPEDVNAVNLTGVVEILPSTDGKVQLSTAPGEDGINRSASAIR